MNSKKLRDAFRYMFPDELPYLADIIKLLPEDAVVVNIGAGAGTSGLLFLEHENTIVHTIDVVDGDSPFGCLYAERVAVEQAGLTYLKGIRWFQHHGDSKKIGKQWEIPVDLVFVDGDHTYDGCKGDIQVWMKHLKPGGIMVVHDYGKGDIPSTVGFPDEQAGPHPKAQPGVDKVVEELLVGKYKEHSRKDSMITFVNEPLVKKRQRRVRKKVGTSA